MQATANAVKEATHAMACLAEAKEGDAEAAAAAKAVLNQQLDQQEDQQVNAGPIKSCQTT